jgi:hypothetical protein
MNQEIVLSIHILQTKKNKDDKILSNNKKITPYHVYCYYQQYHQLNVNRLKDLQDEMYLVQQ